VPKERCEERAEEGEADVVVGDEAAASERLLSFVTSPCMEDWEVVRRSDETEAEKDEGDAVGVTDDDVAVCRRRVVAVVE
jgi:hypothetical protein